MTFWIAIAVITVGTMATRAVGPLLLRDRPLPGWLAEPFLLLTPVVLVALVVVQTFAHGRHLVLDARAAGVGAAVLAAWAKAPVWLVMVVAGVATALVRWAA